MSFTTHGDSHAAPVELLFTGAVPAGTVVWALYNGSPEHPHKCAEIIRMRLTGWTAGAGNRAFHLTRFSGGTPTGGVVMAHLQTDSHMPWAVFTEVRQSLTGLSIENMVIEDGYVSVPCPANSNPAMTIYEIPIHLHPGEGICLVAAQATVNGQGISGAIHWRELDWL